MQRLEITLLVLMLLMPIASCRLDHLAPPRPNPTLVAQPQTPEEVVRRAITLFYRNPLPTSFQVLATHPVPQANNTVLVLYRYQRSTGADSPTVPVLGIQLVEREGQSWKPGSCGNAFNTSIAAPGSQLIYMLCPFRSGNQTYLAFFGHVLSPDVVVVETTPNVGQPLRATVAERAFVLVAPGAHQVQKLRLLDSTGQVLQSCPVPAIPVMSEDGATVDRAPVEC